MANEKFQPEPRVAPDGRQCLCGCGEITTPKSIFRQGHDARVKSMLSRLKNVQSGTTAGFRLPDVLMARAAKDPTFEVVGYNAATILDLAKKAVIAHSELQPTVLYYPDTQTLVIENGERRADGEHVAKGVMVFYAAEEGEEFDHDVSALTIENAEVTLKPFVDAILAKYGVNPQQPVDADKAKIA